MSESGFDTLRATRALEAAGFESGKTEAMVTVFGGNADVRLSVETLRATMYKLLLAQAAVIVGLLLGLQRLLQF